MMENIPSTPSAKSVQRKKKPPLDFTTLTIPVPLKWMTGTTVAMIPPMRVMTYPGRRSVSTSVPYSQTTRMAMAMKFAGRALSIPRTMSSVK